MRKRIMDTSNGYAEEDAQEKKFYVYTYTMRNYDGIYDRDVNETVINYETGLFQEWSTTGYYANYFDDYKGRKKAFAHVERRLA